MRGIEREDHALLGRRRLQLEIEALAEFFPQGEAPGAVDAAAERRVQHQLHPARLVEETLERDRVGGRHHAEAALRFAEVAGDLLCRLSPKEIVFLEKRSGGLNIAILARRLRSGK